jgi:ATP-dependent DNA ligase
LEVVPASPVRSVPIRKRRRQLEGLLAKNLESNYVSRRSRDWLKVKVNHESEFVIAGYTEPCGTRQYLGALLLGVYEGGKLKYAGKVGTGFDSKTLRELSGKLKKLEVAKSPFTAELPEKRATFVRPKLVSRVAYMEWTKDGRLRHPAFLGLLDDKVARDVRREA